MIAIGIHGLCIQETWLLRSFSATIQGHLMLHHGMSKKTGHRGLASSGVAIILGPDILRDWNMTGKPPPITSASNSNFPGQMICGTLLFPNQSNNILDTYHKKGRGVINIFLPLIYYPVKHDERNHFNK